jgi:hypothetical protein
MPFSLDARKLADLPLADARTVCSLAVVNGQPCADFSPAEVPHGLPPEHPDFVQGVLICPESLLISNRASARLFGGFMGVASGTAPKALVRFLRFHWQQSPLGLFANWDDIGSIQVTCRGRGRTPGGWLSPGFALWFAGRHVRSPWMEWMKDWSATFGSHAEPSDWKGAT